MSVSAVIEPAPNVAVSGWLARDGWSGSAPGYRMAYFDADGPEGGVYTFVGPAFVPEYAPAAPRCASCFERKHGYDPDMSDDVSWQPGVCVRCGKADVIVFVPEEGRPMRDTRCETCGGYGYVTGHPADGSPQSPCPGGCTGGWHR